MGQIRHGSATTTHAVRAAIQRSKASIAELSRELGGSPKTVAKWRKRQTVEDHKTGPKAPRSTILGEEEVMAVASRRHTFLPLHDCLYALQPSPPHLTHSSLHRCPQDAKSSHALRRHRQNLNIRARSFHLKSDPPDDRIEQFAASRSGAVNRPMLVASAPFNSVSTE